MTAAKCRSCGASDTQPFYSAKEVPVHSCLLVADPDSSTRVPRGDIELSLCRECGFIWNVAFAPEKMDYADEYEETQMFSSAFRRFQDRLVEDLIARYNLHSKSILEVGCGKGDFIAKLCERGGNQGIGFDPAFDPTRNPDSSGNVKYIRDFYSDAYTQHKADFVVCKMTLEHIPQPLDFLQLMRQAARQQGGSLLFLQVPNMARILDEGAFWDIYYEHCNYFTAASLRDVMTRAGFAVEDVWLDYGDQYLIVVGKALNELKSKSHQATEPQAIEPLLPDIDRFAKQVEKNQSASKDFFWRKIERGKSVGIWGGGSKAVALVAALKNEEQIAAVIDVNPHRQGTYLPGTGLQIRAPESLANNPVGVIIVMNAIYKKEIVENLNELGQGCKVVTLDEIIAPN